jgi:predicted MPP superfamily phosphohydrolase
MGSRLTRVAFLPDTHVPFHSKAALQIATNAIRRFSPDILVVLGDFADFYSVSFHDKSPDRSIHLKAEIKEVRKHLSKFEAMPIKRKIFLMGNHEYRLQRYLTNKAPELFGLVDAHELFKLEENDWEWVPYRRSVILYNVAVSHDFGSSGANAATKAMTKMGTSVVMGHTHRMSVTSRSDAGGNLIQAAMFGWLGDISEIGYANRLSVRSDWLHGFGVGYVYKGEFVKISAIPIIDESYCILEGEVVR